MTERKPPGLSHQDWVERQIKDAEARGEFEHLRGFGKPLPHDDGRPWIDRYAEREQVPHSMLLPPVLALRKQAEELPAQLADLPGEPQVRAMIADLNRRIVEHLRMPSDLHIPVHLVDEDEAVAQWRLDRAERAELERARDAEAAATALPELTRTLGRRAVSRPATSGGAPRRRHWWSRRR